MATIQYKPHKSPGGARLAKSLEVLWAQVNAAYPKRAKVSDGWVGDEAHQARKSDHNPSGGVVHAIDITHDPKNGFDSYAFADMLRIRQDPRISMLISNRRISTPEKQGGAWRAYTGANAHNKHCHISVREKAALADDETPWQIGMGADAKLPPPPPPPPPPVIPKEAANPSVRDRMADLILVAEAARDASGLLKVHQPGDGSYEVGGVSSNSHPEIASELRNLVQTSRAAEAERVIRKFILDFTSDAAGWTTDPGIEYFLRDSIYNRGKEGGAKILQMAVGADPDGTVGPTTRQFRDKLTPDELLARLRTAREQYEIQTYGKREKYWNGLTSRWNKVVNDAKGFRAQTSVPITTKEVIATVGTTVGAGTAATAAKKGWEVEWGTVALMLAIPIIFVIVMIALTRKMSKSPGR